MNPTITFNVVLSCLALAISIFSFYWTTLRNKKALFFVRSDSLWSFDRPQFALINAGKNDVLINEIYCHFASNDPSSFTIQPVKINYPENFTGLLAGGKAVPVVLEFTKPFTSEFALEGTKDDGLGNRYNRKLDIEVNWIDMKGIKYKVAVGHSIYGFYDNGKLSTCRPITNKNELFQLAKRRINIKDSLKKLVGYKI